MRNSKANNKYTVFRPGTSLSKGQVSSQVYMAQLRSGAQSKGSQQKLVSHISKVLAIAVLLTSGVVFFYHNNIKAAAFHQTISKTDHESSKTENKTLTNFCEGNTLSKKIIVDINSQTLYACQGANMVYSSLVTTGYTQYPNDITPLGNYTINSKQTNIDLTGSDGHTNWNDPVQYWMDFLNNQYGQYGIHDASWLSPTLFGHVNINNDYAQASKGCVELPTPAAQWIYNWSDIGTLVSIVQSSKGV